MSNSPYKEAVKHFGLQKTKWYSELETLYPYTESVLKVLSNNYKLGIIANQPAGCKERLEKWGIAEYFDLVISSTEEGIEKPNPEIFNIALEKASCSPENTVMVGDRIDNDIIPAKKIGMKAVWVKQGFATYHQNSDIPDYTSQTLEEIKTII